MNVVLTLFFSVVFISPAVAGDVVGNGGHVIVCEGRPPQVLDAYEAERFDPGIFDHLRDLSADEVIDYVLRKTEGSSFKHLFRQTLRQIGRPHEWARVESLELIPDHGPGLKVPPRCRIEQAAVRRGDQVYISTRLAKRLSAAQLGILAVHEVVYKLSLDSGAAVTSLKARIVVTHLLSRHGSVDVFLQMIGYQFSTLDVLRTGTYQGTFEDERVTAEVLEKNLAERKVRIRFSPLRPQEKARELLLRCDERLQCFAIGGEKINLVGAGEFTLETQDGVTRFKR